MTTNKCGCTVGRAVCAEGQKLLKAKNEAMDTWSRVSGTPRGEYGFRDDYLEAKRAYNQHVQGGKQ